MLDNMDDTDTIKTIVWKRVGELVQIMNDVNPFQRRDVQANASWPFVFPATNIQNLCVQGQFPCVR
jgi:hypothetical protein